MNEDLNVILEAVTALVKKVGRHQVKEQFSESLSVDSKSSRVDLVTSVDKKSEIMLCKGLLKLIKGSQMLGEESGLTGETGDWLWIVDPLDGTTNYAQGLPIFAISIALTFKNEAKLAVVHVPRLDETYTAIAGEGARLNGTRIKVSLKEDLVDCVIATGFPYDRATHPQNNAEEVKRMVPLVRGIRRMGAAAFDLSQVACGHLDGYWEYNLAPWDLAAGKLLIEEAGGLVLKLKARGQSVVCGNSSIVKHVIEALGLEVV